MARTLTAIHDSLIAEKASFSELDGLTSSSTTAIWRLFLYLFAFGIWTLENLWDQKKLDLDQKAKEVPSGTPLWYIAKAKEWQNGDSAEWNGSQYTYPTTTPANQLVSHATVVVDGSQVNLKVAKTAGGGGLEKLSGAEKTSLEGYMDKVKFVGTALNVISEDPDDLKISVIIYVDPTIINPADGTLVSDGATEPVNDAISTYLETLDFGGTLRVAELTKSILEVNGVTNASISGLWAKYGVLSYFDAGDNYNANAGHMTLDTINSTITFKSV